MAKLPLSFLMFFFTLIISSLSSDFCLANQWSHSVSIDFQISQKSEKKLPKDLMIKLKNTSDKDLFDLKLSLKEIPSTSNEQVVFQKINLPKNSDLVIEVGELFHQLGMSSVFEIILEEVSNVIVKKYLQASVLQNSVKFFVNSHHIKNESSDSQFSTGTQNGLEAHVSSPKKQWSRDEIPKVQVIFINKRKSEILLTDRH